MKRITSVLAMAALLTAPLAYGAAVVVTVDDNPANDSAYVNGVGGNFSGASAVKDAVAAITADPGEDSYTINIIDTDGVADTYVGDVDITTSNTVVQQVANGNGNDVGVTLQGDASVNGAAAVLQEAPNCRVSGLSAAVPMNVQTAGVAAQGIITGSSGTHNPIWENLNYVKSASDILDHNDYNVPSPVPADSNEVFNHCTFRSGNGPQIFMNVTMNDCHFAGGGFKIVHQNGSLVVNNGLFDPPSAGGLHNGGTVDGGKTAVYNDCTFNVGARLFPGIAGVGDTVTFNRPVFTGSCGDIMFNIDASGANIIVNGTPDHKVDFDPAKAVLYCRLTSGSITYNDCTGTVRPGAGGNDSANGKALVGDVTVNMNRCIWGNGTGEYVGNVNTSDSSTYKINVNATNTIWYGTTPAGAIIAPVGNIGGGEIDITHCTMAMNTANAFFFGSPGVHLFIEGSIIYSQKVTNSHYLSSIAYEARSPHIPCITYAFDPDDSAADDGTGHMFVGNPFTASMTPSYPNDLVVSPEIDIVNGKGVIPANSPACGAATGSTMTEDVNGNVRPQPANTAPDIGAVEVLNVPVELSSFQVD